MNKKNDILESWIMVEHLSEGDINLKDKAILSFNELQRQDYYSLLADEIQKKGLKKNKHNGVIIYFGIFPFQEVIDFLREEYKLTPTEQEITSGNKFSFCIFFAFSRSAIKKECRFVASDSIFFNNCNLQFSIEILFFVKIDTRT